MSVPMVIAKNIHAGSYTPCLRTLANSIPDAADKEYTE